MKTTRVNPTLERSAERINWFASLEHAILRRRPRKAAEARRELERLGVLVETVRDDRERTMAHDAEEVARG